MFDFDCILYMLFLLFGALSVGAFVVAVFAKVMESIWRFVNNVLDWDWRGSGWVFAFEEVCQFHMKAAIGLIIIAAVFIIAHQAIFNPF